MDFLSILTSSMLILFFVTFLTFKVKSSNTVTASYNYIKYFQVINQLVSTIHIKNAEKV